MEVAAAGLAGPLVANQRAERARSVVKLSHLIVVFPDAAHVGVIGDQGVATTGHLLDQQVEGFHPLTCVPQIVELFAQRCFEQLRIRLLQALGQAQIFSMVGHHEKVERALQSCLLAGVAGDGLAAGKAIGLLQTELGAG